MDARLQHEASQAVVPSADQEQDLPYERRAQAIWPRLQRDGLRRTGGDPVRIARLVARRSNQPLEVILAMLTGEMPAGRILDPTQGRRARVASAQAVSGQARRAVGEAG
jgi:hypothetical protein